MISCTVIQGNFFVGMNASAVPAAYWNGPTRYIQRSGRYNVCDGGNVTNWYARHVCDCVLLRRHV
jgi:hypothetical protein